MSKKQVEIGKMISVCSGKKHAWYESNVGKIRKPLKKETVKETVVNNEGVNNAQDNN
jgi:hypothetical protein